MRFVLIIFSVLIVAACGGSVESQIQRQQQLTKIQLQNLQRALDNGELHNANILREYARLLSRQDQQLITLVNQIATDASSRGPLFQSLNQSFTEALNTNSGSPQQRLNELKRIFVAADPRTFNDALSDPINVLAELSQGQLPAINALPPEHSLASNQAQDFGVGNQLIGNPAYGSWITGSNGMSFWQWYGMYALLNNVMDVGFKRNRQRVYYQDWGRKRNYSYYHDYGRKLYSNRQQINNQNAIEAATQKFARNNGFSSAYTKPRRGATRLSTISKVSSSSGQKIFRTSPSKFKKYALGSKSFRRKGFGFRRR